MSVWPNNTWDTKGKTILSYNPYRRSKTLMSNERLTPVSLGTRRSTLLRTSLSDAIFYNAISNVHRYMLWLCMRSHSWTLIDKWVQTSDYNLQSSAIWNMVGMTCSKFPIVRNELMKRIVVRIDYKCQFQSGQISSLLKWICWITRRIDNDPILVNKLLATSAQTRLEFSAHNSTGGGSLGERQTATSNR